jgi:Rho termination factor, N-terminal domain
MTKTELESKHLSDLHQLAADAGVERYRMLTRAELIERLSDGGGGDSGSSSAAPSRGRGAATSGGDEERPRRRRRRSGSGSGSGSASGSGREREERVDVEDEEEDKPPAKPARAPRSRSAAPAAPAEEDTAADSGEGEGSSRSRRPRRRRRRFGRRREGVSIQDLLLPPESGRQAVLLADSSEAATELLRGVAADLASGSDGPDPIALLIDPSPEELADWKREAPQAELVSAGQARHASDALAAAQRRAGEGEDVILLVDSLTRFAESFGDTEGAKALFDAGRTDAAKGKGSLTVVVALERS